MEHNQPTKISQDVGLDLENRDPTNINEHVKVMFEDAFAEPDGSHSIKGVWTCSYKTFWAMKNCCYIVLSLLCGVPCACCWAMIYACQSFYNIWCYRPCLTSFYIDFKCCDEFYRKCVECHLNPCFDAVARSFSKIRFHHRYEVV